MICFGVFPEFFRLVKAKNFGKKEKYGNFTGPEIDAILFVWGTNPRFKNPYAGAVKLLLLAAFDFEVVCILD